MHRNLASPSNCELYRVRREERSTVKQLLADDFFTPEELIGIRVEIKNRDLDLAELNVEVVACLWCCSVGEAIRLLAKLVVLF